MSDMPECSGAGAGTDEGRVAPSAGDGEGRGRATRAPRQTPSVRGSQNWVSSLAWTEECLTIL